MSALRNERGIALVMALIFSSVALAFMAAMLYMVSTATGLSGMKKRYDTALVAGKGGSEILYQFIETRGSLSPTLSAALTNYNVPATNVSGVDCLTEKLNSPTPLWNALCNTDMSINTGDNTTFDLNFDIGGYRIYSKIVNTFEGNSAPDLGLDKQAVVQSNSGEVTVVSQPYLYTVESVTQGVANPVERAKLSILYQY